MTANLRTLSKDKERVSHEKTSHARRCFAHEEGGPYDPLLRPAFCACRLRLGTGSVHTFDVINSDAGPHSLPFGVAG